MCEIAGHRRSLDALVVPADPQEPVRVIDLDAGSDQVKNLQKEVGGVFDIVGHRECDLVINDVGRIDGSPVNVRVTHFVLNDSTMAKEGRAWEGAVIYGDVVITGPPQYQDRDPSHASPSQRIQRFGRPNPPLRWVRAGAR
jgi:Domain of unknown function (DUF3846)